MLSRLKDLHVSEHKSEYVHILTRQSIPLKQPAAAWETHRVSQSYQTHTHSI